MKPILEYLIVFIHTLKNQEKSLYVILNQNMVPKQLLMDIDL